MGRHRPPGLVICPSHNPGQFLFELKPVDLNAQWILEIVPFPWFTFNPVSAIFPFTPKENNFLPARRLGTRRGIIANGKLSLILALSQWEGDLGVAFDRSRRCNTNPSSETSTHLRDEPPFCPSSGPRPVDSGMKNEPAEAQADQGVGCGHGEIVRSPGRIEFHQRIHEGQQHPQRQPGGGQIVGPHDGQV